MIEAITAIASGDALLASANLDAAATTGVDGSGTSGFANVFEQQLDKVNTDLSVAESSLQKLAAGEPIELHDVMIALETARIGVQTMVQVRNRMVEAYQDLMRMQI
ncbi:MAG: flagellar hook-basal body complex protein FliE [Aquabacterium sp.]